MTTAPYLIEPLVIPAAADSADFLAVGELCDALTLETWGNLDRSATPAARLQGWRDNAYRTVRLFFVRQEGRVVGSSWIRCDAQENLRCALVHVQVLNEFTGRGIGRTLLKHAEALVHAEGRTILQSFTEHPADFDADAPGLVRPATGTGALPAVARGVRFALKAGYRLEQVERFSVLNVPAYAGGWDALEREALAKAGEEYELLSWTDRCPDEHAEQLAVLMSRMSTDAPSGELSYDAERWDTARVRHVEDTWKRAGMVSLVAAARHRGSGELAAYSVLQLTASKPWLADQDDTLVAASHRGHRLGMLVKLLNIRRLRSGYPAVERVVTFNAAENDHMLAINVSLGFRPAGYDGEWQRVVAA
ncbi:GNAT family N-acetyltransferase [Arthrobacter sp. UYCu712]|uniref:GNAT family N-acetyltransferase n=1 Tax=Arthrobacter sp. UYCu712 TaxID=3156340 RepID=UPI003394BA27